jgi:hypothetical protein
MSVHDVVHTYIAAWHEPAEDKRRNLLAQSWAEDGHYSDPVQEYRGREALNHGIAGFQERRPGVRFVFTSDIEHHHTMLRFSWKCLRADGTTLVEGTDFGELASDGRLNRIVGFFGPVPNA